MDIKKHKRKEMVLLRHDQVALNWVRKIVMRAGIHA